MSGIGDAFTALKNVMLMQERIDGLRSDIGRVSADLKSVTEKVYSLDSRIARIEGMIEMARGGGASPRLEG